MERTFKDTLSALRKDRFLSQRKAAAELGISQALLSHYENGAREPGLEFVRRACRYYGVTADYLLCLSDTPNAERKPENIRRYINRLRAVLNEAEISLAVSVEEAK